MQKTLMIFFSIILITAATASPILQMNQAFIALTDLIPFLAHKDSFMEKQNEKIIGEKITELQKAFKSAKHDTILKGDLFAPSYALINENIENGLLAFNQGKKDYAHWRLKEITIHCMDCHTRLPPSHTSSFQNGELKLDEKRFEDVYNLGMAQLIVRRYSDAKNNFIRSIQERIITKDYKNLNLPFKQLLVIDAKVLKNPEDLILIFKEYAERKELPEELKVSLRAWIGRLGHWKGAKELKAGLVDEKAVEAFIIKELSPLKKRSTLEDANDVDLLIASGLLSHFLFENPSSKMAPQISYWLGWAEKHLKREEFFGSGDLFLKQCVKIYSKDPIAKHCLKELKESVEFEFSGSSGTHIPLDVQKEVMELDKLINVH